MAYLVDIGRLGQALGEQLRVSDDIAVPPVDLGEEHFDPAGPAHFDVTLSNTGAGIVASGTIAATMHTTCARCLTPTDITITAEVDGFYVEPGHDEGLPEEQEVEIIRDERVDLEPALTQALVVELPLAPVCSNECRGLCPECGADLNVAPCDCDRLAPSGPFAALKDIAFDEGAGSEGPDTPEGTDSEPTELPPGDESGQTDASHGEGSES
jgi:uncharacterized protein